MNELKETCSCGAWIDLKSDSLMPTVSNAAVMWRTSHRHEVEDLTEPEELTLDETETDLSWPSTGALYAYECVLTRRIVATDREAAVSRFKKTFGMNLGGLQVTKVKQVRLASGTPVDLVVPDDL